MPPIPSNLTYLTINDFTPGIRSNPGIGHSSKIIAPPGVANPSNTYRCRPMPMGGLGPMPGLSQTFSLTPTALTIPDSLYHISAFHVAGPIVIGTPGFFTNQSFYSPIDADDRSLHSVMFFVVVEYIEDTGGGTLRRRARWRKIDGIAGGVVTLSSADSASTPLNTTFAGGSMASTRSQGWPTVAYAQGVPVVVVGWKGFNPGSVNIMSMFPDPDSNAVSQTDTPNGLGLNAGPIIAHQQRIISLTREQWTFGAGSRLLQENGLLHWTLPGQANPESSASYGWETAPTGFGAWASMTSSDLFLVGHRGGAVLIQGDIAAPTIRSLPSVTPTYGLETSGAVTPIGFVYGSNNQGVHLWAGGQESQFLSPDLPGDFFYPSSMAAYPHFKGQFASWGEWILTPANWCFHMPTKSWWKIESPSVAEIVHWQPSPFGQVVYGALGSYASSASAHPAWYSFAQDSLAPTYRWESQVIRLDTQNRMCKAREIIVLADGPGTITITVTGLNGASSSKAFTLSNTGPELHSTFDIALELYGGIVRIDADSGSTAPAPILHEVSIGTEPMNRAI